MEEITSEHGLKLHCWRDGTAAWCDVLRSLHAIFSDSFIQKQWKNTLVVEYDVLLWCFYRDTELETEFIKRTVLNITSAVDIYFLIHSENGLDFKSQCFRLFPLPWKDRLFTSMFLHVSERDWVKSKGIILLVLQETGKILLVSTWLHISPDSKSTYLPSCPFSFSKAHVFMFGKITHLLVYFSSIFPVVQTDIWCLEVSMFGFFPAVLCLLCHS